MCLRVLTTIVDSSFWIFGVLVILWSPICAKMAFLLNFYSILTKKKPLEHTGFHKMTKTLNSIRSLVIPPTWLLLTIENQSQTISKNWAVSKYSWKSFFIFNWSLVLKAAIVWREKTQSIWLVLWRSIGFGFMATSVSLDALTPNIWKFKFSLSILWRVTRCSYLANFHDVISSLSSKIGYARVWIFSVSQLFLIPFATWM